MRTILILLAFTLFGFTNVEQQTSPSLDGTWSSSDDPKSIIIFNGDKMMFKYNSITSINAVYKFSVKGKDLTAINGTDTLKYMIIELNDKELDLIYVPRMKILKYMRN